MLLSKSSKKAEQRGSGMRATIYLRQAIVATASCLAFTYAIAQQEAPLHLVGPVPEAGQLAPRGSAQLENARAAASIDVAGQQEKVLRWNLVSTGDVAAIYDRRGGQPKERIRLSVFPGVEFVVEHARHRVEEWLVNWSGDIIQGGTGTADLRVVSTKEGTALFVNIRSDVGDFNIWSTDDSPYAVAVESNKWAEVVLD